MALSNQSDSMRFQSLASHRTRFCKTLLKNCCCKNLNYLVIKYENRSSNPLQRPYAAYYPVKKVIDFPVPSSLVSDIPAGDGKMANLFYIVNIGNRELENTYRKLQWSWKTIPKADVTSQFFGNVFHPTNVECILEVGVCTGGLSTHTLIEAIKVFKQHRNQLTK